MLTKGFSFQFQRLGNCSQTTSPTFPNIFSRISSTIVPCQHSHISCPWNVALHPFLWLHQSTGHRKGQIFKSKHCSNHTINVFLYNHVIQYEDTEKVLVRWILHMWQSNQNNEEEILRSSQHSRLSKKY